jgi:prepilin-type N-terminal cleavage/methylation domain-containing protein
MMRTPRSEDGFTLLEILLSIGILALTSGFILQMFLVSARVNQKAFDSDMSLNAAMNLIESFKALDRFEDCMESPFSDEYKATLAVSSARVIKCYNNDWEELDIGGSDISDYPPEVQYVLQLIVNKTSNIGLDTYLSFSVAGDFVKSSGSGQLCELECEVFEVRREEGATPIKAELARIVSEKYFSY